MKQIIRLLSLLLVMALSVSLAAPATAAESTAAAAIRLTKTEGTVSISKSSGKSVSIRSNMRLYSGYHVTTEQKSYAWVNLDDAKLVKEDASSEIEIRKSGKKLEVNVISGSLFFNVSEDLGEDETLNISTSTMVVGIRGTSGWVRVVDRWNTQVSLTEGTAQCVVADPVTGQVKTAVLRGGDVAQCVVYPQDKEGDKCDITLQKQTVSGTPGFVLTELVQDVPLCDKILDDSGLDYLAELEKAAGGQGNGRTPDGSAASQAVIRESEKRQEGEQAQTAQKAEEIQKDQQKQDSNIFQNAVWTGSQPSQPSGDGGSSGGGSSAAPTSISAPMKLTNRQAQELLNGCRSVTVTRNDSAGAEVVKPNVLEVDTGLNVAAGKTLTLDSGVDMEVYSGQSAQVDGTPAVGGNLINDGTVRVTSGDTLRVAGNLTSSGTVEVTASGRAVVDGTFSSTGTLALASGARVRAKSFRIDTLPQGWAVSTERDSEGYYSLYCAYTIRFDTNYMPSGSDGPIADPDPRTTGPDGRLIGGLPENSRFGYQFDGWFTAPAGGEKVTTDTVFTSNTTLYAHWSVVGEIGTYTITFAANGGTFTGTGSSVGAPTTAAVTGENGKLVSLPIQPDRSPNTDGTAVYSFDGWFDAQEGGAAVTTDTVFTRETTVYAHWSIASGWDWEYNTDTKALRVFGKGAMTDYSSGSGGSGAAPWAGITDMETATFEDGITHVGSTLFTNRFWGQFSEHLTTIHVAGTVKSVGYDAFNGCNALTDIYFDGPRADWEALNVPLSTNAAGDLPTVHCTDGEIIACSVTFDANGGEFPGGTPDSPIGQVVVRAGAGGKILAGDWPATPTQSPNTGANAVYSLDSWFDAEEGGNEITADTVFTQETTVYAHWSIDSGWDWEYNTGTKALRVFGKGAMTDYSGGSDWAPWFDNSQIETVIVEDGITHIGNLALYGREDYGDYLSNLKTVQLASSVTSIGESAFMGNEKLTSINSLASVRSIGNSAFFNTGLTDVVIPEGVTAIENSTFKLCSQLTSVTIPGSVRSIGGYSFQNCSKLNAISIPEGVESVGDAAFSGCFELAEVHIPVSITTISASAFDTCPKLTDIYFGGNRAQWNLVGYTPADGVTVHCTDGEIRAYTVTFDPNGGTLSGANTKSTDMNGRLTDLPTPTHATYTFNGWYDAPSGGAQVSEYTEFTQNTTVYAYWSSWSYDDATDTLTISGTGDMISGAPWSEHNGTAQKVVIETGVTSISSGAFDSFTSVTSIEIPDSVTRFESGVIYYCINLKSITIPRSVKTIESSALDNYLQDIYFEGPRAEWESMGVTFYNAKGDGSTPTVHCTDGAIGDGWGYNTNTKTLSVTSDAATGGYSSFSQVPWKDYAGQIERITVGSGVTQIGQQTFLMCTAVTEIVISSGVKTIGMRAFINCDALTKVTIPASVTSISSDAFVSVSTLTDIYYGGTQAQWNNIQGGYTPDEGVTVHYNTTMFEVTFNPNGGTTDVASAYAIDGKLQLSALPTATHEVDEEGYSYGLEGWYAPVNGGGVAKVENLNYTFVQDTEVTAHWRKLKYDSATQTLTVGSLGTDKSFYQTWKLAEELGAAKDQVRSVVLADSVDTIGGNMFQDFTALEEITIPDSVTTIGSAAFQGCSSLREVTVPASVTKLEDSTFYLCENLERVQVDPGNTVYRDEDGVIFTQSDNVLFICPGGRTGDYSVPEGTTAIGHQSMRHCKVTSVTLPDSVNEIRGAAFYESPSLTRVNIPANTTVVSDSAFEGCASLRTVTIPADSQLTRIKQNAFNGCSALESITVPSGVESIGSYAFRECSSLAAVSIPADSQLTSIGNGAFYGCSALTAINIPAGVARIENGTFYQCSSLATASIPADSQLTEIGDGAFNKCAALERVNIPDTVTKIGREAFRETGLTEVTVPGGCDLSSTSGAYLVFFQCPNLKTVVLENGVTQIFHSMFSSCTSLTSVTIPDTVTGILSAAFASCTALTEITIPASVASIDANAFDGCSSLTQITFEGTRETWNSFAYKPDLSKVTVTCNDGVITP